MTVKSVKSNKLLYVMLFSLVVIGLVILTNYLSFLDSENLLIEQLKREQSTETEFAATRIEIHILQVKDELVTLTKFPIMDSLDINTCSGDMKIVHEKIEGKINSLLRVDRDGNVIECSSPQFQDYVGLNIKNKDYFKIPKESNEPFITGLVRQGERQQVIVTAPLFETTEYTPYPNFRGEFEGLLMSIIELDQLYNSYVHTYVDKERNFFLLVNVDSHEVLLRSDSTGNYKVITEQISVFTDGSIQIAKVPDVGDTIITSSDIILGSETWRLIFGTPLKNAAAPIKSAQIRHIFGLSFVGIAIISIFFFLIYLHRAKEDVQSKLDQTNVTLKKLGISIQFEKNKFNQAELTLDTGKIYLIKQDEENHAFELFINSLNKGFAGLGIVRDDPRLVKKKYDLQKTSFIWLTNIKSEMPCETNIDNIYSLVSEFIKTGQKSVILIDRLDYILTENKFEDVIKKIHSLKDLAARHECIIILSVNPVLLEEGQVKAIEAETIDLYGTHLRKRVELTDMEMEILQYINDKNLSNKLASYGDITDKFKITKPTTRVKIDKLHGLNLLSIEQKGRFKALKITSAGRRII